MRGTWLALTMLSLPLAGCGSTKVAEQKATPPSGQRLTLVASNTVNWQEVSAEIATVNQASVLARIPGILVTLSVRAGDTVRKGQAIGRIVDSQLGYQAGAFGAQAAAAQAQAAQARGELSRVRFLYQNGVYAKARLEQAEASSAAANAQIRAAQAQQAAVGAVAGHGVVVAPATGRVLRADIPAGSPVAAGMAIAVITAGPTILRLTMPESLGDKVHPGSRVTAGGNSGTAIFGRVIKLYPSISEGQVAADVDIPGIDNLLIGRRLAAKVEIGTRKVLTVPPQYITNRYGIDYVTVLAKDGSAEQVPVQLSPSDETGKVEILSGVNSGDTLVAAMRAAGTK